MLVQVRTFKMHMFTMVQLFCLGVLWAVKSTPASLGFPFFLIVLVPIRKYVLRFVFTPQELEEVSVHTFFVSN